MNILYRCDGGRIPEIGTGHLARGLVLADQLRSEHHKVAFAIREDNDGIRFLKTGKHKVFVLNSSKNELTELQKLLKTFKADVLVLDKLQYPSAWIKALQKTNTIVCSLDNDAKGAEHSDILINSLVAAPKNAHSGYEYLILKPYKTTKKLISDKVSRIVLSFGGYDHDHLMLKAIRAVNQIKLNARVEAIVGNKTEYEALSRLPELKTSKVKLLNRVKHFDEFIQKADLAVVSGGLTLFQALSHGIPCIVMCQYPHQNYNASRLQKEKSVVNLGLGKSVSVSQLAKTIKAIIQNKRDREKLSLNAQSLIDRKGCERTSQLIQMVKPLPWDSQFFGVKIARLYLKHINDKILSRAFSFCAQKGIDCLYFLADEKDASSRRLAEEKGFDFVDARETFECDLNQTKINFAPSKHFKIETAGRSDSNALKEIARTAHVDSRFFSDLHFDRKKCEEFYEVWIQKSLKGYADTVLIARNKAKMVGYVSCKRTGINSGDIPLIAVHREYQGQGIGKALVLKALEWFKAQNLTKIHVVTQGKNVSARNLYLKCNFVPRRKEIWYHTWL